jgi:hypothetical protein
MVKLLHRQRLPMSQSHYQLAANLAETTEGA